MLKLEGLLPQLPDKGPPLPRFMGKEWPKAKGRPTEKRTREVKLPKPPEWMSRLPFESQVDKLVEKVNRGIREAPLTKALQSIYDRMPKLPEVHIPTPLGEVRLPAINPLPEPTPPQFDQRRKDILKASLGVDLASIPGYLVPVIGDYIEEELGDLYMARMRELMTAEEFQLFQKFDKFNPLDVMAAARALIHAERK